MIFSRPRLATLSWSVVAALTASACATTQPPAPTTPARSAAPAAASAAPAASTLPRTPDGKPNFQGIWQVRNRASYDLEYHAAALGILPGQGVVVDGPIPYLPAALAKRKENFAKRAELDPFGKCYMPGVPRVMYLEHPFQIFQGREHIAMAFEWSQNYRLVYLNGSQHIDGIEFWMGDSRGRWDGDTLVVEVLNHNDQTWFDASGNYHSADMKVTERYRLLDADTIQYEATIEDPKVFSRPWTIRMPIYRQKDMDRLLEFNCQAEREEANGDFERDPRTWYTKP